MAVNPEILLNGYRPTPIEPSANALGRIMELDNMRQRNALARMQFDDMHAQRQAAMQQAQQAQAQQQQRDAYLSQLQGGAQLDPLEAQRRGFDQKTIEFLANRGTLGMPEVARTVEGAGAGGMPQTMQLDKFGRPVGQAIPQAVKMTMQDIGGLVVPSNPYAPTALTKTMSPEGRDSSARGWAGVNLQRQQAAQPTWDASNQVWVNRQNQSVTPGVGPDGKPLPAKMGAATEDERKAAGWLAQADNAWENMRKVAFGPDGKVAPAAKPGLADAIAAVPGLGATGNYLRTADRQKFNQAASSLSEALLRAATGAGVNKDEALQKVQELTPVFGESAETTKQKFDAVPMYLKALKDRAGRAAPGAYAPGSPTAPGNGAAPPLTMPANPNAGMFDAADAILRGGR